MSAQSPYAQWLGASVGTFRLEQLLDQGALGPVFLGHERASGAAVRIRILTIPPAQTREIAATYHQALEREAVPMATLRPPYILPLTDYGIHQGLPYLVWPHLVMRPLSTRLAQSGPMDVVTVGRYLDQIATALESAHAVGLLHRNLSTDCVFMQLDGQTVVADFGVRHLLELLGAGEQTRPFYGSPEACAPEQLLRGAVGPYTDVYALGALTYRMLIGQPVFVAETVDALLQQHLFATIPSVHDRRPGLPGGLDRVLTTALAKEPSERFASPGALADAYHEVVSPGRVTRVPFAVRVAVSRLSPQPSPVAGAAKGSYSSVSSPRSEPDAYGGTATQTRIRPRTEPPPAEIAADSKRGRLAALIGRPSNIIATVLLIVLLASSGWFIFGGGHLFPSGGGPSAEVKFVDSPGGLPGDTDALDLSTKGLGAPPNGSHYDAWILNQETERVVALGALTRAGQTYSLAYAGDGAHGQPGTNLLSVGDKLEVTTERGDGKVPVGAVALMGWLPPHAFIHIQHLLVSFPDTPNKIGLLVGVLSQAHLLNDQASVLQNAQASRNTSAVQCSAQSILDLIEGVRGANYRLLPAACAAQNITLTGDGYGLLAPAGAEATQGSTYAFTEGYLDNASNHASLAATQDDTTANIRTYASHVEIAIANTKGWVTTADQDALTLRETPTDTAAASALVQLCSHAYHGVPSTIDQQIHPVSGQAGAITAYEQGQLMATLTLGS